MPECGFVAKNERFCDTARAERKTANAMREGGGVGTEVHVQLPIRIMPAEQEAGR